jgi:hypothetical protein
MTGFFDGFSVGRNGGGETNGGGPEKVDEFPTAGGGTITSTISDEF